MRDINRIANALERIADALTDGKPSSATSSETVEVEPEVIASTPLTPAAYRAELDAALEKLQAQVRSGLLAYHKRGGDAEGLILETINEPLKSNELDSHQCRLIKSKLRNSSER